jgi:hypothetical protein
MGLRNITAIPHPFGNRIDLKWVNPAPDQYPGMRLIRREDTHPASPEDGMVVAEGNSFLFSVDISFQIDLDNALISDALRQEFFNNQISLSKNASVTVEAQGNKWQLSDYKGKYLIRKNNVILNVYYKGPNSAEDKNLRGETMYYYTLFTYKNDPPEYKIDRQNRASAMATAPYNMAGQMYELLPRIYHRYDTRLPQTPPDGMLEDDKKRGQLRRFLDLSGSHLDQFYSFARAVLNLHNLDKVDGRLLPLLAQWIGCKTDYTLEIDAQRNEIRDAPSVYKTIGLIPTVEATVKRISGWESLTKEFVHNVFMSNRPERLNIWACQRSQTGGWSKPTDPLSLNFAYEGRPTAVRDGGGSLWLFYHTLRKDRWNIWYKRLFTFSIGPGLESDLDDGASSTGLRQAFEDEGHSLSQNATIEKKDSIWLITDADDEQTYTVRKEDTELNVYKWTPSQPLTDGTTIDKDPSAAFHDGSLWVFWAEYSEIDSSWSIKCRTLADSKWSEINPENLKPFEDDGIERKLPSAVVDDTGGLWLFWLEKEGLKWKMKYKRVKNGAWSSTVSFPLDGGEDPRVEGDPFVLFHPNRTLWVFWARKTGEPGQTRWTIVYRVKGNINPNAAGWSGIQIFSTLPSEYHDREPAAFVNADDKIELFWSSNLDGNWSIWQRILDVAANTWGPEAQVTTDPYSQRAPLPVPIDGGTLLIYRSNESLSYTSEVYRATRTVDFRYAGSTTVHTRDTEKIALKGKFEDFQTYTYDAGQNDDWYARDTIGLYLKPDTMDIEKIDSVKFRIGKVLEEFMPVTDRAVFITQLGLQIEHVYTYGLPLTGESNFISETYKDTFIPVP